MGGSQRRGKRARDHSVDDEYTDEGDGASTVEEVGFWASVRAALPFTKEGKQANFAEEMLNDLQGMEDELARAKRIQAMFGLGMHDKALDTLIRDSEGQTYADFHRHRYAQEVEGKWIFITPTERRRRQMGLRSGKVSQYALDAYREYKRQKRDKVLRIRDLCYRTRRASGSGAEGHLVDVVPQPLVDEDLLAVGTAKKNSRLMRLGRGSRRCSWVGVDRLNRPCLCLNPRFLHPYRTVQDDLGMVVPEVLSTCAWHAVACVGTAHANPPAPAVSTPNEYALCNECLVEKVKRPLVEIHAWEVQGVKVRGISRTAGGTTETSEPLPGELVDQEGNTVRPWFTASIGVPEQPGGAPPDSPPYSGLRAPAAFPVPLPLPLNQEVIRRLKRMQKMIVTFPRRHRFARVIQATWRGYCARREVAAMRFERPSLLKARWGASVILQALVRRFLARCIKLQIEKNRYDAAVRIQSMVRRKLARRHCARLRVKRKLACLAFGRVACAKVRLSRASKRTQMSLTLKREAARSIQRVWREYQEKKMAAAWSTELIKAYANYLGPVTLVQRAVKRWRSRRQAKREEIKRSMRWAAGVICRLVHRRAMYRREVIRNASKELKPEPSPQLQSAATTLASAVRGMVARKKARDIRAVLDAAWRWTGAANATSGRHDFLSSTRSQSISHSASTPLGTFYGGPSINSSIRSGTSSDDEGMEHFIIFDRHGCGLCSKVAFSRGLQQLCIRDGYPLTQREIQLLVGRFYDGDGSCEWKRFLREYNGGLGRTDTDNPAERHARGGSCVRHGRLLCGPCRSYGACKRAGCSCEHPHAQHGSRQAAPATAICTECRHPFSSHQALSYDAFVRQTLSTLYLGVDHGKVHLTEMAQLQKLLRSVHHGTAVHSDEQDFPVDVQGISFRSATAIRTRMDVRRNSPKKEREVPAAVETSRPEKHQLRDTECTTSPPISFDRTVMAPYAAALLDTRMMGTTLTETAARAGRLAPVQSLRELDEGFLVAQPIPVCHGDSLLLETNPTALYLHVLSSMRDPGMGLAENFGQLTTFVTAYQVVFERHWKKLIKDVRSGGLNDRLPITAEARAHYTSRSLSDPERANALDEGLKRLGFHCRESKGTGKKLSSPVAWKKPASALLHSLSKPASRDLETQTLVSMCPQDRLNRTRMDRNSAPHSPTELGDYGIAHGMRLQGHSRPSTVNRVANRSIRSFICGSPGCGRVYHTQEAAKHHAHTHAHRHRVVATATPLVDQHLRAVWPDGAVWCPQLSSKGESGSTIAPYSCPICLRQFVSKRDVGLHLRCGHTTFEIEKHFPPAPVEGITARVGTMGPLCPPLLPPGSAPAIPSCRNHLHTKASCSTCREAVSKWQGPAPPARFYASGELCLGPNRKDMRVHVSVDQADSSVLIECGDAVHVVALVHDGSKRWWVAGHRIIPQSRIPLKSLLAAGLKASRHPEQCRENFMCMKVEYFPAAEIIGRRITFVGSKEEVRQQEKASAAPSGGSGSGSGSGSSTGIGVASRPGEKMCYCQHALADCDHVVLDGAKELVAGSRWGAH